MSFIRTLLWKDYELWRTSMTDSRPWRVVAPYHFCVWFFRRELKNRFTGATFHLSDTLNRASIATS